MAKCTGVAGNVTLVGGYVMHVHRWELDWVADAVDVTDFASAGDREFIPGLRSWSGSYECHLDDAANVIQPGAAAAAGVFQVAGGQTLGGDVIVTSVRPSANPADAAAVAIGFQGTGILNVA